MELQRAKAQGKKPGRPTVPSLMVPKIQALSLWLVLQGDWGRDQRGGGTRGGLEVATITGHKTLVKCRTTTILFDMIVKSIS